MADLKLGGNSIDALKLGLTDVTRVYLGDLQVWSQNNGFLPGDLSPAFWFDADDGATITLASGVSAWANKGIVAFNASQINSALRPTLMAGGLNGRSIIRFTMSPNTYLEIPAGSGLNMNTIFNASGSTVFVLKKFISGVVEFKIEQSPVNRLGFEGGNRIDMPNDTTSKIVSTNTTGAWICMLGRRESTQVRLYYNGVLMGTQNNTNTFSTAAASLGIGATAGGFFSSAVDIAEILVYPRALNSSEINLVFSYIATKWGIAQTEL